MSMYHKVMLAPELTDHTEQVVQAFYSACPKMETEVFLVHVIESESDVNEDSGYYKKVYAQLEAIKNDLFKAGYDDVKFILKSGSIYDVILDSVEENDIDLTMLYSHKKGLIKSKLLGSTTFDIARSTTVPLLIIKGEETHALWRKILVPTDFSSKSLAALNVIRNVREIVEEVVFAHIVERSRNQEQLSEKLELAKVMSEELVEELNVFGIKSSYIIKHGVPSKEICNLIDEEGVSLTFTAKTGAGLVKGLLMGSTAQNVILNSNGPIFIMPDGNDDVE